MPFDAEYVSNVLSENLKDAQALFLQPLLSIHYAHLAMLAEQRIISVDHARTLRDALDTIAVTRLQEVSFASWEDLFFHVERLIADVCGGDVAGGLHTARSRTIST